MAATVKRDGIRKRRFRQSSTKYAITTPYNLQWPGLGKNGKNKAIMDQIVRTLEPFHFKQLSTKMPTASAEDNDETAAAAILVEQEERAKKLEQRSSLVIGLSQVIRALEKGTLKLVLVDRSIKPFSLLEHLLVLCVTRKTPACAISGIPESTIPMLLGVRRVAAFGFKNMDTPTIFDELVRFIKERIPPLYVPWLNHGDKNSNQLSTTNPAIDDDSDEDLPGIEEMPTKRKRRRTRKPKKNTEEMNTQSTSTNPAVENTGRPMENTGRPIENAGRPMENTGSPIENTGRQIENTGRPVENTGKLKLTREELHAVFGTTGSLVNKTDKTKLNTEKKEKKKTRRRSKKNQGKKKPEPPVKLVYLRPCIKSFGTAPSGKGDQAK